MVLAAKLIKWPSNYSSFMYQHYYLCSLLFFQAITNIFSYELCSCMCSVQDMPPLFLAKFSSDVSNSTPANTFHHLWWLVCSFLGFLSEHLMLPHLHLFCCHSLSFLKEALKVVTWDLTTQGKLLLWASGICGPRVLQSSKISFLISLFKQVLWFS